jgi:DNA-binding CsgD family transcriptional regulator
MTEKKIITYVCSAMPKQQSNSLELVLKEALPVEFQRTESIPEIFPLLSDPNFRVDFINICVEEFDHVHGVDTFALVRTLSTLIECTVYRPEGSKKPVKRTTKIGVGVTSNTDPALIKEIMQFSEISNFICVFGGSFTFDDALESLQLQLDGSTTIPKKIQGMLKAKKKEQTTCSKANCIVLTPRQRQIFDMVLERGSSNKIIARSLNISESTVKLHLGHIFKKYGVKSRTQLAVFAQKNPPCC